MNRNAAKFLLALVGGAILSGCANLGKQIEVGWGYRLPDSLLAVDPPPKIEIPKNPTEKDGIEIVDRQIQHGELGWERLKAAGEINNQP